MKKRVFLFAILILSAFFLKDTYIVNAGAPADPGPVYNGQYPGQYPGQYTGQYNGQYNGQYVSQYPGQYTSQYPGQYPAEYTGQNQFYPAEYPSQYPGQYPGQYPSEICTNCYPAEISYNSQYDQYPGEYAQYDAEYCDGVSCWRGPGGYCTYPPPTAADPVPDPPAPNGASTALKLQGKNKLQFPDPPYTHFDITFYKSTTACNAWPGNQSGVMDLYMNGNIVSSIGNQYWENLTTGAFDFYTFTPGVYSLYAKWTPNPGQCTLPSTSNTVTFEMRDQSGSAGTGTLPACTAVAPTSGPPSSANRPPTITSTTISPKPVNTQNGSTYTITITGTDPNGGNDIGLAQAIINYHGLYAGTFRGMVGWVANGNFAGWNGTKSTPIACPSGGGFGAINADGFGESYINLQSCSTSVTGNTRTTSLVVSFDPIFITPTANNTLSGLVMDWTGLRDGWRAGDTFNLYAASYSISGNVFIDQDGNKSKNGSEANYTTGNSTITVDGNPTTTNNGVYNISNIPAGNHTASYTSLPSGYNLVHPQNGPPPSFSITLGSGCTGSPAPFGSCDGSGNITALNFGISNSSPWIQGYDLDIRFDDGFSNTIPLGKYALTTDSSGTTPGIVFTGDVSADFGTGQASTTNQVVGGSLYPEVFSYPSGRLHTSYGYILNNANRAGATPTNIATVCGGGGIGNCKLNPSVPSGIYKSDGDLRLTSANFNANKNYIFIINGSLIINTDVTVNNGTAFFTASGNIVIDKSVGAAPGPKPASGQVQGFYSTDRNFILNGYNNCANPDKMLNLDGAMVINASGAGGTFTNQRNLCADNSTVPAFTVSPRLDMILNAPPFLLAPDRITTEVAP